VRLHKRPGRGNQSKWALMTRFNNGGGELPVFSLVASGRGAKEECFSGMRRGKGQPRVLCRPARMLTKAEISGELQHEVGAVRAERFVTLLTTESQRQWSIARWLARGALLSAHPCI
jgi:hypothetical protein